MANYVNPKSPDGSILGQSASDLVGFHGVAGTVQGTGAAMASIGPYTTTQTSAFGFSSSAQINEVLAQLKAIRDLIVAKGLHAGA